MEDCIWSMGIMAVMVVEKMDIGSLLNTFSDSWQLKGREEEVPGQMIKLEIVEMIYLLSQPSADSSLSLELSKVRHEEFETCI